MSRKFRELSAPIDADPIRRARVEAHKRAIYASRHLAELRKERALTQKQMATLLGVSQARISQIERGVNLELETLSSYVEALGGHLCLSATFPDTTVALTEAQ
jgi:DNA-binding XRE family transcriptional regulator